MGCLTRWYNTSRAARHRNKGGARLLATAIDDNERMSVAETEEESGKQSASQSEEEAPRGAHLCSTSRTAFALLLVRVFLSLLSLCPSPLLLSLTHSRSLTW